MKDRFNKARRGPRGWAGVPATNRWLLTGSQRRVLEVIWMKIAKVVKVIKMSEAESDADFWRQRPVLERLAALEEIRAEFHGDEYESESGLQRVFSISKLQRG